MSISFNSIPSSNRVPFTYVEFDNSGAIQGSTAQRYKGLLIGQKLASGTVQSPSPLGVKPILQVTSADQANTLFGKGSMLASMAAAWLKNNTDTELYCLPLDDDDSGVAAAGSIAVSGPATAAGTLSVYIADTCVSVAVTASETANDIATALGAAINAKADLPVSATVTTSTVALTCKWKGETGNAITIQANFGGESYPAGVSITATAIASGTKNPSVSDAITAMGDLQFNIIVSPYTDSANLALMKTEMDTRWGPSVQKEGVVFMGYNGGLPNMEIFGNSQNSQLFCTIGTGLSPTMPYVWASAVAAVVAYYGAIDPARPFQTLAVDGVLPPKMVDRLTMTERNTLLYDGISTYTVDADDTVRLERIITMYQKNSNGTEDPSYLDLMTILTLAYIRYDYRNMLMTKYPRCKLADDGTQYGVGQCVVTPSVVKAETIARAKLWESAGLVENIDAFKTGLIVERNATDRNRIDVQMTPDLVNQLMVAGVQIKYII